MSADRSHPGRVRQVLLAGLLAIGLIAGGDSWADAAPAQAGGQEAAADPCAGDAARGAGQWDCLPFYRWADDADSFYSNFGYKSAGDIASSTHGQPMATLLYGLAGMIWQLLMWITRTALAFDVFSATGPDGQTSPVPLQPLNDGFATVADVVLGGFGPLIVLGAALMAVVRLVGPNGRGAKSLIRPVLCASLLLVLLVRAGPGPDGGVQAGSPAWFAERVIGVSNLAADRIATTAPTHDTDDPPDNLLDCRYYVDALRSSFEDDAGYDQDMLGSVAFQPHLGALMSTMWETAYLDAWTAAQFGTDRDLAHRTYCRMLEDRNGTPPAEQAAIHQAAMTAAGASVPAPGLGGYATAPFGRFNGEKDFRRGMVAWAVCGWYEDPGDLMEEADGALVPARSSTGFVVNPEFRLMWNLGSPPSETKHQTCSQWWGADDGSGTTKPAPKGTKWMAADGDGPFQFGTGADIDEAFAVWGDDSIADVTGGIGGGDGGITSALGDVAAYEPQDQERLPAAKNWVTSLNGHNLTRSVGNGFLAIIIALVFLWALGGLAVGVVFAQYLTVAYLVFKPILLLVGMWPSEGAGAAFWKVTRLGIGSVLAKTVFVTVLSALVTLIHLLNSLPALRPTGGSGFGAGILYALTPLAAVVILRWAIKSAGLGNIFSLRGAVGLTGQLARGAGGMYDGPGIAGRAGALAHSYGRDRRERNRDRRFLEEITRDRDTETDDEADDKADLAGAPGRLEDADDKAGDGNAPAPTARDRARALLSDLRPDSGRKKAAWVAGAAVALPPLTAGAFAAAPLVGGVALAHWAAGRTQAARLRRAAQDDGRQDNGRQDTTRPPALEDMARLDVDSLRGGYSRYVETVNAAAGAADPRRSDHHPDVRSAPTIVGRELGEEGKVYGRTASGSLVPQGTAPWGAPAGEPFTTRSGYRTD